MASIYDFYLFSVTTTINNKFHEVRIPLKIIFYNIQSGKLIRKK